MPDLINNITELSVMAIPGRAHHFTAKTAAVVVAPPDIELTLAMRRSIALGLSMDTFIDFSLDITND